MHKKETTVLYSFYNVDTREFLGKSLYSYLLILPIAKKNVQVDVSYTNFDWNEFEKNKKI